MHKYKGQKHNTAKGEPITQAGPGIRERVKTYHELQNQNK